MPVINGRGFGSTTQDKEEGFEKIISQILSIVKQIKSKKLNFRDHGWVYHSFNYIDACSGQGDNPEENCDGSPAIFIEVAERVGLDCFAHFIEKSTLNYNKLNEKLDKFKQSKHVKFYTYKEQYEYKIPDLLQNKIPSGSLGIIYFDATRLPSFELIKEISEFKRARHMDILIHLPANGLKRINYHPSNKRYGNLINELKNINKTNWLIRDILPNDAWQMTFLFGTNYKGGISWESQRFYNIASQKGKEILMKCALNEQDYNSMYRPITSWGAK